MTDKPIIFSGPMVKAILEGRKSMTRRVLKPQPDTSSDPSGLGRWGAVNRYGYWRPAAEIRPVQPGDRLWVKEAIRPQLLRNILTGEELPNVWAAAYDADGEEVVNEDGFNLVPWWKRGGKLSPIFMPRWASRLTLTVTDVRVQRVRDISLGDCYAEGCTTGKAEADAGVLPVGWTGPWDEYGTLWNSLHAKPRPVKGPDGKVSHYVSYPWESGQETRTFRGLPWIVTGNPWVAAYTFTVQRGNIDGGKS